MKQIILCGLLMGWFCSIYAQEDLRAEFEREKQDAIGDYFEFRKQCMDEYIAFVRESWKDFEASPAVPTPETEPEVPPVIYNAATAKQPTAETNRISFKKLIPLRWRKEPQPEPIAPVVELPRATTDTFSFRFFGTIGQVRLDESCRFQLASVNANDVADALQALSDKKYENLIFDCLALRKEKQLSDWAYYEMLQTMSEAFLGEGSNEATLLMAYVFLQSGYKMRLASNKEKGKLYMLISSKQFIFNTAFYRVDGEDYYLVGYDEFRLTVCDTGFPKETALSLAIDNGHSLSLRPTEERTLQSQRYPEMKVTICSNKNLIDFYNTYPSSEMENNFMTRWAMYANTPLEEQVKAQLYPALKEQIEGNDELEAVNKLLNFVQTAFVYEYDENVWGYDRAFFSEETLFYPFCDCEDRSILFSRLVRDLLGLRVVLVYYPGHLATAVRFTDQVAGDYIDLEGAAYTVCDPTYIGAPVGDTMPLANEKGEPRRDAQGNILKMDNQNAVVILLDDAEQTSSEESPA